MPLSRKLLAALVVVPVFHQLVRGRPGRGERSPAPGSTLLGRGFAGLAAGSAFMAKGLLPPTTPAPAAQEMPSSAHAADMGVTARSPADYSFKAWKAILRRVWTANNEHNISLMSAGVAFYTFLSFVPLTGFVGGGAGNTGNAAAQDAVVDGDDQSSALQSLPSVR